MGLKERIAMAEIPYHAANVYFVKLIQYGFTVAVIEDDEIKIYPEEDRATTDEDEPLNEKHLRTSLTVLEVENVVKFMDVDGENKIKPIEHNTEKIILSANTIGKPKCITQIVNGTKYKAVQIADKIYILNVANTI